jgi:hypothetical protein
MKRFLDLLKNRWQQYMARVFFVDTNNNHVWYKTILLYILSLDILFEKRLKFERPSIVMVSDSLLMKSVVFVYSFLTNIDLTLISPKFTLSEICNAINSRRHANVLFLDIGIESKIKEYEKEEGINVLSYYKIVVTTARLTEMIEDSSKTIDEARLNKLYRVGVHNINNPGGYIPRLSVLSPGTSAQSTFTNVPYEILAKSVLIMSYFMGLKKDDIVSVVGDFEFFPNIFTLLGFFTGLMFVQPVHDIESAEDFVDQMKNCKTRPSIVVITSAKFKLIWDSIILNVYGNRLYFFMSTIRFLDWIPRRAVLRQLRTTFGKSVQRIHILNEELGFSCLEMLRHSKLGISSSYGYLEQGNFLAFKDPQTFRNRKFFDKPGGSVLLDSPEVFDYVGVDKDYWVKEIAHKNGTMGEVVVKTKINGEDWVMKSGDMVVESTNTPNQGKRIYLHVLGRKSRITDDWQVSLDTAERCIKDTIFVRDCFFIKTREGYRFYIEPRDNLLDIHRLGWDEVENSAKLLVKRLKDKKINVIGYAVLRFSAFRNVVGKLQYWAINR